MITQISLTNRIISGENRTEIRIEKCVMTPDADPNYSTQHELIIEGCGVDDTVEYHDSPNFLAQRFSFQAFRFNERPTAVVYMHCYIDVCSVGFSCFVRVSNFFRCKVKSQIYGNLWRFLLWLVDLQGFDGDFIRSQESKSDDEKLPH